MKYLNPIEVTNMPEANEIFVNRITVNSRLVELILQGNCDTEVKQILYSAIKAIKSREAKTKIPVWGAKMSIKDIKKAFDNIEKMSKTSFAIFG